MTAKLSCPQCGASIQPALLDGLCVDCVVETTLRSDLKEGPEGSGQSVSEQSKLRLGDYELESEIARGGVGVVYRARQISLNRWVALKLLLSGQFADADQVKRFRAEAEAVARLDHPAIVPVYEVGESDGRHFFSMKLIVGRSLAVGMKDFGLAGRMRRAESEGRSLPSVARTEGRQLAAFLAKVARAVHYAHQRGVLHRDLKPANVLLDGAGEPHVTDFGLARLVGDDRDLTRSGYVFGTPAYMPPEQTEKPHEVTVEADVYSLGAIGYELFTGQPPFDGGSAVATVLQVREREPVPPREREPLLDRDLDTILLKCLLKSPEERYRSALELAEDLERYIADEPIRARATYFPERVWRWARRRPAVASLSAALTLLAVGVAVLAPSVAVKLSFERNRAKEAEQQAIGQLREARLAQARAERLSGEINHRETGLAAVAEAARHGTDGPLLDEAIAQLARFDARTDQLRPLPQSGAPIVMTPDFSTYIVARADGTIAASVTTNDLPLWTWGMPGSRKVSALHMAPDGRHLLLLRGGKVEILNLPERRLVADFPLVDFFGFSGDGTWFLLSDLGRRVQRYETATGRNMGTLPFGAIWRGEIGISSEPGSPLIAVAAGRRIELYDCEAGKVVDQFSHSARIQNVSLTGDWVAGGDVAGNIPVWHLPSRRNQVLSGHRTASRSLLFLPGTTYLFSSVFDGQTMCWDVASGERLLLINRVKPFQLSADGRKMLYGTLDAWGWTELQQPQVRLRIPCIDSGDDRVREIGFAPDGRWLLVTKQAGVHIIDRLRCVPTDFIPGMAAIRAGFVASKPQLVVQTRAEITWYAFDPVQGKVAPEPLRRYRPVGAPWLDGGSWSADKSVLTVPMVGGVFESIQLEDGRVVRREARNEWLRASEFDIAGDNAVFVDAAVKRLNLGSSKPVELLTDRVAVPRFSPNGKWLLLSAAPMHQVIRVADWKPIKDEVVSARHSGLVAPGAWSADSRFLALVASRSRIQIYHAPSWRAMATLTTSQPAVFSTLAFSPGRRWLAAGTDQGSVELWDVKVLRRELNDLGLGLDWTMSSDEESRAESELRAQGETARPRVKLAPASPNEIPARPAEATSRQIDLTAFYNTPLQEPRDRLDEDLCHLELLPPGLLTSDGTTFDVRGILQLSGRRLSQTRPEFPSAITNIPVRQKFHRLHLLGAVSHGPVSVTRPRVVAVVRLRYRDGTAQELPLRLGVEIEDIWDHVRAPLEAKEATIGWRGLSHRSEPESCWVRLSHAVLVNPRPEEEVLAVDLVSTQEIPSPFFAGLTLE